MIPSTVSTMASARCSAISLGVPAQPMSLWLDGRMNTVHAGVWGSGIRRLTSRQAREFTPFRAPDVVDEAGNEPSSVLGQRQGAWRVRVTGAATIRAGLAWLV